MAIIGQAPNAGGIIGTGARRSCPRLGALSGIEGNNKILLGSLFLDTATGDQTVTATGLAVAVSFGSAEVGTQSVSPSGLAVPVAFGSPTVLANAVNNAVACRGQEDVMALGAVGALSGFSIFVWAKIATDRNDYSGIFSMERRDVADHSIEWNELITDVDGTTLKVFDHVTGDCGTVGVMTVGTWYRIGFIVRSNGTWKAFIGTENSGAAMSTATGSLTLIASGNNYAGLFSTNFAATEWFNGDLALFRKWDAELSDAEMEAESHSHTPVRTANLLVEGFPRDVTAGTALVTPTGSDFIDGVGGGTPTYQVTSGPTVLQNITPSGLAVPVAFGTASVALDGQTVSPSGIAAAVAFGSASVQPGPVTVTPSGLAVGVSFGSATVSSIATISPSGLAVPVAFGSATVQPGAVSISPSGLAVAVVFGTGQVNLNLSPSGLAVAVAFGLAQVQQAQTVSPSGLAVPVSFGSATLDNSTNISPSGLAVPVAFGSATVQPGVATVSPSGLAVNVSFGSASIQPGPVTVSLTGLAVSVSFGSAEVVAVTNQTVSPIGLAVSVVFGDSLVYNDPAIRKPATQGIRVVQMKPWPPPRGAWWFNGDR